MILSDTSILQEIAAGNIVIQPFDRESLGVIPMTCTCQSI